MSTWFESRSNSLALPNRREKSARVASSFRLSARTTRRLCVSVDPCLFQEERKARPSRMSYRSQATVSLASPFRLLAFLGVLTLRSRPSQRLSLPYTMKDLPFDPTTLTKEQLR